jgi:hypothetical protein
LTRKSESKGSQKQWEEKKQSNGDGLLTVSKSNQLKITLPNSKIKITQKRLIKTVSKIR